MKKVKRRALEAGNSTRLGINNQEDKNSPSVTSEVNLIEDKISATTHERLEFFNNFFSEDNQLSLCRVIVYSTGSSRGYTIVKFDQDKRYDYVASTGVRSIPYWLGNSHDNLEEYLRYLYARMVEEVEYFNGIPDEEFQAIIKAIFVHKDLTIESISDNATKETVICLSDSKNTLFWAKKDVIPVIESEYLKVVKSRYSSLMDGSVNIPDFTSLYTYFRENPFPNMKVLRLDDACDNPFKYL